MEKVALQLLNILNEALPKLQVLADEYASVKPEPGKWSKKEILGHLIDSACNNQQKIVRGIVGNCAMPSYVQDEWVAAQNYQQRNWLDLVKFWCHYNMHIAHLIAAIPASSQHHNITVSNNIYTLEFVATDYVAHLKHHLAQIL